MARVIGPDPQGEDRRGLPDLLPGLRLEELLREVQERIAEVVVAQDRLQGLLDAVLPIGEGLELDETPYRIARSATALVDARYGRRPRRASRFERPRDCTQRASIVPEPR